jgi:hypothetical protein
MLNPQPGGPGYLFLSGLPFDLPGMGDPAGIALQVTERHKLPHHNKVETPSGENKIKTQTNNNNILKVT